MGWPFCNNTAPRPLEFASTDNLVGLVGLKYLSTGASVASFFNSILIRHPSAIQRLFQVGFLMVLQFVID